MGGTLGVPAVDSQHRPPGLHPRSGCSPGAVECRPGAVGCGGAPHERLSGRGTDASAPLTMRTATRQFVDMTGEGERLPHMPALDGLRGLAVAGVLAFHAGLDVMVGGYLGVSTFFTLSGFLITSLLLRQVDHAVDVPAFWRRRFRRLMPASLFTIAAVLVVFTPIFATASQRATVRGDSLASLLDVANWWYLLSDDSYGALFVDPSPLLHFWSLAIEEQFYLAFPLLLVGVWKVVQGHKGWLAGCFGALIGAAVALPFVFDMSDDRVYFGTDTRAPELLIGALLAVVLSSRALRRRLALRTSWRGAAIWSGAAALSVQMWMWWSLEQSTTWLYRGGFALYALLSAVVITAALLPTGPVAKLLAAAWIRWLGTRSYGVYLFHWPIFLVFRQELAELGPLLDAVLATALTLLIAECSYRWVELPVRRGDWPSAQRAPLVTIAAVVLVAMMTFLPWTAVDEAERIDFDRALDSFEQRRAETRSATEVAPTTTVAATPPVPRIATFGDSTALQTAIGLANYRLETTGTGEVLGDVALGCSVSRFDANRFDVVVPATDACRDWPLTWPQVLDVDRPDIAQLVTGAWEVPDVRLPGSRTFSSLGDPTVDAFVLDELRLAADTLSQDGAMVLMVLWPAYASWAADGRSEGYRHQADPARMARLHELQRQVAAERPDTVRILDLASWVGARAEDRSIRPDGIHFSESHMTDFYREWMAAETDRIWADWWREHRAPTATAEGATSSIPAGTPTD